MSGILLFLASRSESAPKVFAAMLAFLLIRVLIEFSRKNPGVEQRAYPPQRVRRPRHQKGIQMGEMQERPEGTCQVCGASMKGGTVRCETCRTPHHRECWNYLGRCSTYACPGRRAA